MGAERRGGIKKIPGCILYCCLKNDLFPKIGFHFATWSVKKIALQFTAGPLNFVHAVDMCVMKVPKLKKACPWGSLSDALLHKNGWFITLVICLAH